VNLIGAEEYREGLETHCRIGLGHKGFLIHFPQMLLGSTRVTSSSECPRRGYLQEKVTSGDGRSSSAAIFGQMYHQLIQSAMLQGQRKGSELYQEIKCIVASMPEALLDADISAEEAEAWLRDKVPLTLSFLNKFVRQQPLAANSCKMAATSSIGEQVTKSCITKVEEVEDYFVSPSYGLKGFIDVTASLKLDLSSSSSNLVSPSSLSSFGPFEIKTGNPRPTDAAQVLLYLLALEEKYGVDIPYGMLFHLKEREPTMVKRDDNLLACLLATRNTVAASLARTEVPSLTHMKTSCLRCFDRSCCALVHASRSKGTAEDFVEGLPVSSSDYIRLKQFYDMETRHLNDKDLEFLAEWDKLLDLEAVASNASRHEIWTLSGREREKLGRCVTSLSLCSATKADFESRGNNHVNTRGMLYTFGKSDGSKIMGTSIVQGEPVLLSVEGGPMGVSKGHVFSINNREIVIHTDKPIRTKCLERKALARLRGQPLVDLDLVWKIDKEEVGTTVPRMRGFLYDLFGNMEHPEINERRMRLRKLIVGLEHPGQPDALGATEKTAVSLQASEMSMNEEQTEALRRSFAQPGYSLVLGVPGAGKTTAIVGMIKALASEGKRVLLMSYTNTAVDHVMLKLQSSGFDNFLRIGRKGRVNRRLEEFLPSGSRHGAFSPGEMKGLMAKVPVVGVSALGVTDTLLRLCDFDACIVDEAGQITLPAILGAIIRADKFILVGDHNQLPPLVQSPAAEDQGLDVPLFARLAKAHPDMVITLSRQYRMSEEIQSLCNTFVYNGTLRCGTKEVATARLAVDMESVNALHATNPWMQSVLLPDNPVLFIDTSGAPQRFLEHSMGDITENNGEADLAIDIAEHAVQLNVQGDAVAIISPYRSQVALINEKICARSSTYDGNQASFECLTIDKAQGRDKELVIVSLVKSNERQDPGKLLKDLRRVNVAITRAKTKLILLGDASTLKNLELFSGILQFMRSKGWILPVQ
jgi:DNA replication ATP-dependent helicase Dna2